MLIALNNQNKHVLAHEEGKKNKVHYLYPVCKGSVCLKKGEIKLPHFAHLQSEKCQVFSEGETEEHLIGKRVLYNWFIQQGIPCQLEAYIPSLKQRPDLVIWLSSDQPCAIEFQCSPLSIKRLQERTQGYKSAGYAIYWILGSAFLPKKNFSMSQRAFFTYRQDLGFQLYYLDAFKKQILCLVRIREEEPSKKISYQSIYFNIVKPKNTIRKLIGILNNLKKAQQLNRNEKGAQHLLYAHFYLNQSRFYRTAEMKKFQQYLYERGESLVTIPKEVYFPFYRHSGIKTSSYYWHYLIIDWLMSKGKGSVFSESIYKTYIFKLVSEQKIELYQFPQISTETIINECKAYLSTLKTFGLIEKVGSQQWLILKKPYFYKNENEKMTAFKQHQNRQI
ncbi:hypothetical protein CYV26_11145 [Carnobacterium maltaromaticum]|uniref:competence protein CoiA n=1 Tax=Carnobacterium maltaromaticum TaxID=2751 RepID=UPI000C7920B6|nr:competence protein CoiA family protein [Carnobacterium maltaromaticum]PLS34062.1 hypothetical protein CYV30_12310 [Carnobacterium maltaromaticum]PLS34197.1 hypothetical protein CYV33_11130 [Carnobacterium maltaromaticum]PLS34333.1 hypothetical protein CYV31_12290 [Carnobacterium maltaromaticum]PLS41661.1 hypothetical protein CYV28_12245 [Carnobacterium maltaromaticum]PLS43143.1 hypothetical protein CYV27_11130 [Carnobacterium maltaromaticum]